MNAPPEFVGILRRTAWLETLFSRSSRGNEAQISSETIVHSEPPYVGCYCLNGLPMGKPRAVSSTPQTILLQTFYPGLTRAGGGSGNAVFMNLHIGTPDLSGSLATDPPNCRMNPAFRFLVGSTSNRRRL
jgi:hypothetical protein